VKQELLGIFKLKPTEFTRSSTSLNDIDIHTYITYTYIVTCTSDCQRDFGLETKFIDHFNKKLVTTLNYIAIAHLYILQITTAHSTPFQCAMSSPTVPW
jgi:hypothetical protein